MAVSSGVFLGLHLPTWLGICAVTLSLAAANLPGTLNVDTEGGSLLATALISQRWIGWLHGWPFVWLERFAVVQAQPDGVLATSSWLPIDDAESAILWDGLLLDAAVAFTIIAGTVGFLESNHARTWMPRKVALRSLFGVMLLASVVLVLIRNEVIQWGFVLRAPLFCGLFCSIAWIVVLAVRHIQTKTRKQTLTF